MIDAREGQSVGVEAEVFSLLRPWIVVALGVSLLLVFTWVAQRWLWGMVTDDAYISFRYVARLVQGDGLTFNNGAAVEGFSNPLWVLWLALNVWVSGGDLVDLARSWGFFFFAGTFVSLWWACGVLPAALQVRVFLFSAALLLLTPGVQVYATLGLEVPLLMCLLMTGVAATVGAAQGMREGKRTEGGFSLLFAAVCFGLVGITRPEGALYVLLWGLAVAVAWRMRPLWLLTLCGVISAAPFVAYEAFRVTYYGAWVPNTGVAKVSGLFGDLPFVSEWAQWMPTFFVLLALVVALWVSWREVVARVVMLPVFLGVCASVALAGGVFQIYAGSDWMLFGRFLLPVWPLVVVGLCALLEVLMVARGIVAWWALALRGFVLAASIGGWTVVSVPFLSNQGMAAMLMRGGDQVVVGKWLGETFPGTLTVGTYRLGAVSYYAPQHVFYDFLGLTDRGQALAIRQAALSSGGEAGAVRDVQRVTEKNPLFLERVPDIVLLPRPVLVEVGRTYLDDERDLLQSRGYVLVRTFRQGQFDFMDVWLKKK